MTTWKFANFFAAELTQAISAAATTITVTPTAAAKLPIVLPASDVEIRLVLWDGVLPPEIVAVTVNDQSGNMTVVRAKESTTAQQWQSGTQVRSAITAEVMNAALAAFFNFTDVLNASFLKLTGGTLTGALLLNADPTVALGAATKQYADTIQGNRLPTTGGTMSGSINMNNNRVLSLPTPVSATEAASKGYIDGKISNIVNNLIDILPNPKLTSGSGSAYTFASIVGYPTLFDGLSSGFSPHVTNGLGATYQLDTSPAKPLRSALGVAIPPGTLVPGMPVAVNYSAAQDSWLLQDTYQGTQDFIAGDIKHSMQTADHGRWLLADGRAIARTTVALYNVVGTTWGAGDGVTTFNILDGRGRVLAGRDDMGGVAASRITNAESGLVGTTLGASGGVQSTALTTAQLAVHAHTSPSLADPTHSHTVPTSGNLSMTAGAVNVNLPIGSTNTSAVGTGITLAANVGSSGSGSTHTNLQPTSIVNIFVRF